MGSYGEPGSLDNVIPGGGASAKLQGSSGVAVMTAGSRYLVADAGNNIIRELTADGMITTYVGGGAEGYTYNGYEDGTGVLAKFQGPQGIALRDAATQAYIVADTGNNCIRLLTGSTVTRLAGNCSAVTSTVDGTGTGAGFSAPCAIAAATAGANAGTAYVVDASNRVRSVTPAGVVATLAGGGALVDGNPGTASGSIDGDGTTALFQYLAGVAVDVSGSTVYVVDASNRVRSIVATSGASLGTVTTLAGGGGGTSTGTTNGFGSNALFDTPSGIAADPNGLALYVVDGGNNAVRAITINGALVSTVVGGGAAGNTAGYMDGVGSNALFDILPATPSTPSAAGVAVGAGILVVCDVGNSLIRTVTLCPLTAP